MSEPDTLNECRACGNGLTHTQCLWCAGTGMMTKDQYFAWRAHEQRRRAASSSYPLIEYLVRDTVSVMRDRPEAEALIAEADTLLEKWYQTESQSDEREGLAKELRRLHRQLLELIKTTTGCLPGSQD